MARGSGEGGEVAPVVEEGNGEVGEGRRSAAEPMVATAVVHGDGTKRGGGGGSRRGGLRRERRLRREEERERGPGRRYLRGGAGRRGGVREGARDRAELGGELRGLAGPAQLRPRGVSLPL